MTFMEMIQQLDETKKARRTATYKKHDYAITTDNDKRYLRYWNGKRELYSTLVSLSVADFLATDWVLEDK
jgi:hypothetical protein